MQAELLKYISLFFEPSPFELSALMEVIEIRNYNKKTQVIGMGDNEPYMHLVIKGIARKYFYNRKEEVVIQIASEGQLIFSTNPFFNDKPSDCIIETIETTTFYSIHKVKIETLYREYPRFEKLAILILIQAYKENEQNKRDLICYSTKQRFSHFMQYNQELLLRVPQKSLASYLNIKPETFSRMKHIKSPIENVQQNTHS